MYYKFINILVLFGVTIVIMIVSYVSCHGMDEYNSAKQNLSRFAAAIESLKLRIENNKLAYDPEKRFDVIIKKASKVYGIEVPLIKSVIKAESNWGETEISQKGAKGLMQIMPENFKNLDIINAFDPEQNIMGGTRYLKQMLIRFNHSLPLALAAYNAGPGIVEKYNEIPPFPETREYIKKVIQYYNQYKK
jgi:soluble lytic murein transglycosylase-like protein